MSIRAIILILVVTLAGCAAEAPAAQNEITPTPAISTPAPTPEPTPEPPTQPPVASTPPPPPPPPPSSTPPPQQNPPPATSTPPPPKPAEPVHVRLEHDYANPDEAQTFDIPENAGNLRVSIAFYPREGQNTCSGGTIRLQITDPDGRTYANLAPDALSANVAKCSGDEKRETTTLKPGEWRAIFTGAGAARALVDVSTP